MRSWTQQVDAALLDGGLSEVGVLLVNKLQPSERPAWVARVLDRLGTVVSLPAEALTLSAIARDESRWAEAGSVFNAIRARTRSTETDSGAGSAPRTLYVLENAAKVIANAGGRAYDDDVTIWFVSETFELARAANDAAVMSAVWDSLIDVGSDSRPA